MPRLKHLPRSKELCVSRGVRRADSEEADQHSMPPSPEAPAGKPGRPDKPASGSADAAAKSVMCLVPQGAQVNPLEPLLRGYELAVAASPAQLVRLVRRHAFDLYVLSTPLGWMRGAEVCGRIRRFDPHTPIVVYAAHPAAAERRDVLAAGAQAYVPRAEGSHVLSGIAAQLVMLTELRSMDAMTAGGPSIRQELLARFPHARGPGALRSGTQARLKAEARRLFAKAGGSRANFERLWPSLYGGLAGQPDGVEPDAAPKTRRGR